jgi:transposase
MRKVEKALRKKYGNAMKKLTVSQGKLLLLLIDRQTGFTTYELVQELRGNFNASMYQGLAILFGHSLKLNYEPKGKHWMIEDIVRKIELGII